jgi:hypothetical protein
MRSLARLFSLIEKSILIYKVGLAVFQLKSISGEKRYPTVYQFIVWSDVMVHEQGAA